MIGVAALLAAVLIHAGVRGWSVWPTILVGAAAQLAFRVARRAWRRTLFPTSTSPGRRSEVVGPVPMMMLLAIGVLTMTFVCGIWYGVGRLLAMAF